MCHQLCKQTVVDSVVEDSIQLTKKNKKESKSCSANHEKRWIQSFSERFAMLEQPIDEIIEKGGKPKQKQKTTHDINLFDEFSKL